MFLKGMTGFKLGEAFLFNVFSWCENINHFCSGHVLIFLLHFGGEERKDVGKIMLLATGISIFCEPQFFLKLHTHLFSLLIDILYAV